jgi:hypothetical protein
MLLFGIVQPWQAVLTSAMSNARRLSARDCGLTGAGGVGSGPEDGLGDRPSAGGTGADRGGVVRNVVATAGLLCSLAACSSGSSASSNTAPASGSGKTLTDAAP